MGGYLESATNPTSNWLMPLCQLWKQCESSDWKSKLVGLSAEVQQSIWVCVLGLQDKVSHLVPVHCCVHRVELAIKDISTGVDLFKSLEATLV